LLIVCQPLAAETGGGTITGEQAESILNELKQIRILLQRMEQQGRQSAQAEKPAKPPKRKKPPTRVEVAVKDRPMLGEPDAPITMVEFVDYECPFCRRFFATTYQQLKKQYIDPGKVKLVVKDMPLGFHRQARKASQAAHCAGEQGSYWPMHDQLFGGSAGLNPGALQAYAKEIGIDVAQFNDCMEAGRHLGHVDADAAEAQQAGVTGTPAFIIGKEVNGRVAGPHIRGALPFRVFQGHLDRLLAGSE